jgi:hypothetical protein
MHQIFDMLPDSGSSCHAKRNPVRLSGVEALVRLSEVEAMSG